MDVSIFKDGEKSICELKVQTIIETDYASLTLCLITSMAFLNRV